MEVADYIQALEQARDQMNDAGFVAEVRSKDPPSIGSFLYIMSPRGAVEVYVDGVDWYVDCCGSEHDHTLGEHSTNSLTTALDRAREWLSRD